MMGIQWPWLMLLQPFSTCALSMRIKRAISNGVVKVMMEKIMDNVPVDEMLTILAMVSTLLEAFEDMVKLDDMPCLHGITSETTSEINKENCAAILWSFCLNDETKYWREIVEDEIANGTLSRLPQNGTSKANSKADDMIEKLNNAASTSNVHNQGH